MINEKKIEFKNNIEELFYLNEKALEPIEVYDETDGKDIANDINQINEVETINDHCNSSQITVSKNYYKEANCMKSYLIEYHKKPEFPSQEYFDYLLNCCQKNRVEIHNLRQTIKKPETNQMQKKYDEMIEMSSPIKEKKMSQKDVLEKLFEDKIVFEMDKMKWAIYSRLDKFIDRLKAYFYIMEYKARISYQAILDNCEMKVSETEQNYLNIINSKVSQYETKLLKLRDHYESYVYLLKQELSDRDNILIELNKKTDNINIKSLILEKPQIDFPIQQEQIKENDILKECEDFPQKKDNFNKSQIDTPICFDPNEFKTFQYIIYKYMIGQDRKVLAKVIAFALKFDDAKREEIINYNNNINE